MESCLRACPLCGIEFPLSQIERHVDIHFKDDQFERDRKLAQEIASTSSLPSSSNYKVQELPNDCKFLNKSDFPIWNGPEKNAGEPESIFDILEGEEYHNPVSILLNCQIKGDYFKVEEGIMVLLRRCLEVEYGSSQTIICGHVDHFQGMPSEDKGWGCGWRNIQMLSSHLLSQSQSARKMLFGGSGFVPDIASLQRWLEIAWSRGFDYIGGSHYNFQIYGEKKRIGTAECAALFRSFGLHAQIVEFGSEVIKNRRKLFNAKAAALEESSEHVSDANELIVIQDKFSHRKIQCNSCRRYQHRRNIFSSIKSLSFYLCQHCSSSGEHDHSEFVNVDDAYKKASNRCNEGWSSNDPKSHQVLVNWVWSYFSDTELDHFKGGVSVSSKTPLYFQHHGHSRTIVGIQRRQKANNTDEIVLLILDPGQNTEQLVKALRVDRGWQRLVKKGVHTLQKPEYELCYVTPGVAYGEDLECLKVLKNSEVFHY